LVPKKKERRLGMPIVKVVEVIAESKKSWEDAAEEAVKEASKTLRNIKHIYIEGQQGIVEDDKIVKFRVNAKVSFLVD
jgi:flavin-binding protein dodecin